MRKAAGAVKATKLVEPAWLVFTAVLSVMANSVTMGVAGLPFFIALLFHEMGHYIQTKREGYRAQLFWFIPLLGAVLRLPRMTELIHVARIAFAGPFAGLLFTITAMLLWITTTFVALPGMLHGLDLRLFLVALASIVLNVFNLIPLDPLDGGKMASAMSGKWPQRMRLLGVLLLLAATAFTKSATMLVVWILVVGSWSFSKRRLQSDIAVPGGSLTLLERFDFAVEAMSLYLRMAGEKAVTRLKEKYRSYKFWRYAVSLVLIVVLALLLARKTYSLVMYYGPANMSEYLQITWLLTLEYLWTILGELMFSAFGVYFVHLYYMQWKYPQLYHPVNEQRGKRVSASDAKKMTKASFLLVGAYALVALVLFLLYLWRGPTGIVWS